MGSFRPEPIQEIYQKLKIMLQSPRSSMISMIGTAINALSIIAAGFVGAILGARIGEERKDEILRVLALAVLLIGIKMSLSTRNPVLVTGSIVLGTLAGEAMGIEGKLNSFALNMQRRFSSSNFAEGFVTSTLLFCVGSMAIIGPIQEGLTGDISILLAKSMLDGVAAFFLASVLGMGVVFSSISVVAYQGFFTLLASYISPYLSDVAITELTATGGLLIIAISMNLMGVVKFRVGNMLPSLLIAPAVAALMM